MKPKKYSFFVNDNSERKKAKDVNGNVVVTINHSEYKNVLKMFIKMLKILQEANKKQTNKKKSLYKDNMHINMSTLFY